jgi:hypothetical protein
LAAELLKDKATDTSAVGVAEELRDNTSDISATYKCLHLLPGEN